MITLGFDEKMYVALVSAAVLAFFWSLSDSLGWSHFTVEPIAQMPVPVSCIVSILLSVTMCVYAHILALQLPKSWK